MKYDVIVVGAGSAGAIWRAGSRKMPNSPSLSSNLEQMRYGSQPDQEWTPMILSQSVDCW